jgi:DNA-binding FrmR family transcriptional regulator
MTAALTVSARPRQRVPGLARRDAEILARLRKARGQLTGVENMYDTGRYCIDVLDQLAAVRAAVDAVGLLVLEDHLKACVRDALEHDDSDDKVDEVVTAVRRFVRSR